MLMLVFNYYSSHEANSMTIVNTYEACSLKDADIHRCYEFIHIWNHNATCDLAVCPCDLFGMCCCSL